MNCGRRAVSEFIGTAFLVTAVVGSGIMAERLSGGNAAIALLANSLATGGALLALILTFGPVSGAHLNPVITLTAAIQSRLAWRDVPIYVGAEVAGGFVGVACANGMFGFPFFFPSMHARSGSEQILSESLATFGLVIVIWVCVEYRPGAVAFGVAAYITAAYWFTPSTSFANPAVTLARALTNTATGIRPQDVSLFIAAQLGGAALAVPFLNWLRKPLTESQRDSDSERVMTR